ncbi:MAG: DUF11 domain-containing protein [Proteobacteria bacterium]|nr:MAG: DUF11 domain-containing protein [Pseudomonadota bacterium]
MKYNLTVIALLCACGLLQAAPGLDGDVTISTNTTINEYAQVTNIVNAANIVVTVNNINNLNDSQGIYSNANLSPGDRIMLYQAQGANYSVANDNSAAYGAFTLGNAGRYEIHEVLSVSGNDIVVAEQGNLCFSNQLIYSFDASNTQVIRIPQFNNLTINAGVTVTATPWNGLVGGVLAMDVAGNLIVNGSLDVSGFGFRGGVIDNSSAASSEFRPDYFYPGEADGAEKGESILGFQTEYDSYGGRYGRGAPANGGGGGNSHNGGGGGGANGNNGVAWLGQGNPDLSGSNWNQAWDIDGTLNSATASSGGGRGGYTYGRNNQDALTVPPGDALWSGNNRRELGGLGGRPVPFDDVGRLFFGGGGGAGDGNNSQAGAGGAGGGLIYIVADTISGGGTILANGANGENTQGGGNNDAPGGGGAGGTVLISANTMSSVTINADGGFGGDQLTIGNENEGPGGGGGGGVISISGGAVTTSATGGGNGLSNSTAVTEFMPNGATMGADGQPNEITSPVTNLPICVAGADVQVDKSLTSSGPYIAGSTVTYSITVTNNGLDSATNVQVTDTPSNLSIISVSSSNCSAFPCTIPTLLNGASEVISVSATINSTGAFDNSTTVVADQPDPDLTNNTDNTGNGGTAGASADVAITKTLDTAGPYSNGQSIQYTLVVSNNGPDTANNVQVTDSPTNLTINTVSSSNCSAFPCTIPSLNNGGSEIIAVTATINSSGAFDNAATVSANETDPNTGNNTDNTGNGGTAGASADMQVVKNLTSTGPYVAGDTVTYSITVTNNGPDTANNVQVTDTPTNLTITSVSSTNCSSFPCTIPSLINGASEVIALSATIDATGAFDNAATVSANEIDPNTGNNIDNTGNGGTAGTSADMAITKTLDTSGPFSPNQSIQYTLVISNNGPDTANNVVITDTPSNLTITSVNSVNCSALPCTIPSMINGGSEIITVTASINGAGNFDNAAAVSANETDPVTANNQDNTGNGGTVNAPIQPVPGLNYFTILVLISLMAGIGIRRKSRSVI